MKTAVETVFVGKDRLFNRRFLQMCSHYNRRDTTDSAPQPIVTLFFTRSPWATPWQRLASC
jgi:hypothetical protein